MDIRDKLYDAFGELIYLMAMADGAVQDTEIDTLKSIVANHEWSKAINWSFSYEHKRKGDIEDTYKKVIHACVDVGPHPQYEKMIEVMEAVADSNLGVSTEERLLIDRFRSDLLEAFSK